MKNIQITNNNIQVSVVIPTYKPGTYLYECLDSLCNQTFPYYKYEVIIVLNGCKEPYENELDEYIKRKNNVNFVYLQLHEGGVSNARNKALDIARGEYITFIDDDDFVSPSYLEELYQNARPNVVSLCYPLSFVDGTNRFEPYNITRSYRPTSDSNLIPFYKAHRYFGGPVYKLIHRNIIADRRFDVRYKNGEDTLFMFLISNKLSEVSFTSKNAVYYRRFRNNSATTCHRSLIYVINNSCNLSKEFIKIYCKGHNYKFIFLLKCLKGQFYTIIDHLLKL